MTTHEDHLVAAGPSVDLGRWRGVLDELMTRAGGRFRRVELRRRARAFVLGLHRDTADRRLVVSGVSAHWGYLGAY